MNSHKTRFPRIRHESSKISFVLKARRIGALFDAAGQAGVKKKCFDLEKACFHKGNEQHDLWQIQ